MWFPLLVKFILFKSSTAKSLRSSAPSFAKEVASTPPAIRPITKSWLTPYVGGHSTASSTPSLPLVPAPIYINLPPFKMVLYVASTTLVI